MTFSKYFLLSTIAVILCVTFAQATSTVSSPSDFITSDGLLNVSVNATETVNDITVRQSNITINGATLSFASGNFTLVQVNFSQLNFSAKTNNASAINTFFTTFNTTKDFLYLNNSLVIPTSVGSGIFNVTMPTSFVSFYLIDINATSSASIAVINDNGSTIANTTNLYGERGKNLYFNLSSVTNGARPLTDLSINVTIINSSGGVHFTQTQSVTTSNLQTSTFAFNDYALYNYTITITDTVTMLTTTYTGSLQVTNIAPTITLIQPVRNQAVNSCVAEQGCGIEVTINDDGCSLGGYSATTVFNNSVGSTIQTVSNVTFMSESVKNYCVYRTTAWTPTSANVGIGRISFSYTDAASSSTSSASAFDINSPTLTTASSSGGGGGGSGGVSMPVVYQASPEVLNQLEQQQAATYQIIDESSADSTFISALRDLGGKVGSGLSFSVLSYDSNGKTTSVQVYKILAAFVTVGLFGLMVSGSRKAYKRKKEMQQYSN